MNNKSVFWIGILGILFFAIPSIIGGFQINNYNPVSQFISESMAIGTPNGKLLRYYGYIPSGILLSLFSFIGYQKFPKSKLLKIGFIGLGLFYGVATIIVGIFPCDIGCNPDLIDPSISQLIHNLTGFLTYVFVPISLIIIGLGILKLHKYSNLAKTAFVCGLISILFIALLFSNPSSNYIGLYQRIIESLFAIWIVICSIYIKNMRMI